MGAQAQNVIELTLPCTKCKELKTINQFNRDSRRSFAYRYGRHTQCKSCIVARTRKFKILNDDDPIIVNSKRTCTKCLSEKGLVFFPKTAFGRTGRDTICKKCKYEDKKQRHPSKPKKEKVAETPRDYQRLFYRGVSAIAFKAIFDSQNGLCGICEKSMDFLAKDTCLDHDHATGLVRGILCGRCNLGIGHLKDNTEVLHRAISYLEKHESGSSSINDYTGE